MFFRNRRLLAALLISAAAAGCSPRSSLRAPPPDRGSSPGEGEYWNEGPNADADDGAVSAAAAIEGATFVSGTHGQPLSPGPGRAPHSLARGDQSLLLEADDSGWIRVLDAEGNAGWLRDANVKRRSASLRACRNPFRITSLPPAEHDRPDFNVIEVPEGLQGRVLGASAEAHPYSLAYIEARGRATALLSDGHIFKAPLAHVDFGGLRGWAGLEELCSPGLSDAPRTVGDIQSLGVVGLLHPFFVQSFSDVFADAKPPKQGRLRPILGGQPSVVSEESWSQPIAAAMMPKDASGVAAIVLFEQQRELYAIAVVDKGGRAAWISLAGDESEPTPVIVRVENEDLNGDGRSEVLLELGLVSGDGVGGQLLILDGAFASDAPLQFELVNLGADSGESEDSEQSWSWYVEPRSDGHAADLWTFSSVASLSRGKGPQIRVGRYVQAGEKLRVNPAPQPHVAFKCGEIEKMREQKMSLALAAGGPVALFRGSDQSPWCVGKAFEGRASAQEWVSKQVPKAGFKLQRAQMVGRTGRKK